MTRAEANRIAVMARLRAAGFETDGVIILTDDEVVILKKALDLRERPEAVALPQLVDLNRREPS